jgi:bifunctional DNase/RNase
LPIVEHSGALMADAPHEHNGLVQMDVSKIRIDERRGEQVVVLKERGGNRLLPIIIGISEVTAIKMKISGIQPPRPLTHDLLQDTIAQLGATLARIVITKLEFNTFFAKLILQAKDGTLREVDARPSDSIAVALRADAPIFVSEEVLNQVASSYGL